MEPGFSAACFRETPLPAPSPRGAGTTPPASCCPWQSTLPAPWGWRGSCPGSRRGDSEGPPRGLAGLKGSLLAQLEEALGRGRGCPPPSYTCSYQFYRLC